MQQRRISAWLFAIVLLLAACQGEGPQAPSPIDPLSGLDTTKALITPAQIAQFDSLLLFPFRSGNFWGFADTNGTLRIPASYDKVQPFREGLAIVTCDTLHGLIDKTGREIVPIRFSEIHPSSCGILTLRTPAGYILLGINGKRLTQAIYTRIYPVACSQGRIPVVLEGKAAFLDLQGHNITGFEFEEVFPFHHGLAPVKRNGKWGMIGLDGKDRVDFHFEALYPMVSGNAVGMEKDKTGLERWGVIDSTGKTIVPFQFGRITGSFQGTHLAAAARDPMSLFKEGIPDSMNTWFIFDRNGNITGETHAHPWDDFSEGLVVADREGKYGFIDETGKTIVPFQYDWACAFRNGLAWVGKEGKYGFIDHSGKQVIPLKYIPVYDYVYMEEDGALVADAETKARFYIDRRGKEYREQP